MSYYHKMGDIPHKRHTVFRRATGELLLEEMIGLEGFSGKKSLSYHYYSPTEIVRVGEQRTLTMEFDEPKLLNRMFHTGRFPKQAAPQDAITSRQPMLANDDVILGISRPTKSMDYFYRTANGDELFFVHEGSGKVQSILGTLTFGPGDYVVIPGGILYKIVVDTDVNKFFYLESSSYVDTPSSYRNKYGQYMEHVPFSERDIRVPDKLEFYDERGEFEIRVKLGNTISTYYMGHHPMDVVGWDGCVYPYAFNIRDFEPLIGRVHLPPPVHLNFEGSGFVVCSFVPRLFDFHPQAVPISYYHNNIDAEEVLYYVEGNFMSRKNVESGSLSIHPSGLIHGPQPGKMEEGIGKKETNELAVMVDTFRPLKVVKQAEVVEDKNYMYSWIENK